jgi:NAD(P)-dependent dehydrogenase (short-subunit alcohol dehydrogenase family)
MMQLSELQSTCVMQVAKQTTGLPRVVPNHLEDAMTIADRAVLVTGAKRGIGQALVDEALRRGAKRVYAGTRQPFTHADSRVTSLSLDVTDAAQIQAAAERVEPLDVLINNAGLALYDDMTDRAAIEQQLAMNLFGPLAMTQAFLPLLTRSRGAS